MTARSVHDTSVIPARAVIAVVGTLLGLALLLSFRTPDLVPALAGGLGGNPSNPGPTRPVTAIGGGTGASPTSGGLVGPGETGAPTGTTAGGAGASGARPGSSGATGRTGTPSPTTAETPAPTSKATPRAAAGDVVGPIEQTPYGNVQVEVKANGGQITDVVALQLPYDRRRSAQISQYVEPILHDEALQAQSAQIDLISGATWTSGGYQASLEGALARLAGG